MQELYAAWILFSAFPTSGMLMGAAAAIAGLTCMIPTAPPCLAGWLSMDSW